MRSDGIAAVVICGVYVDPRQWDCLVTCGLLLYIRCYPIGLSNRLLADCRSFAALYSSSSDHEGMYILRSLVVWRPAGGYLCIVRTLLRMKPEICCYLL